MKQFIIEDGNFTILPNECMRENKKGKRMHASTIGVYAVLLSLPEDWDYTVAGLMSIINLGEKAITKSLIELERFGYLKRIQIRYKGKFGQMSYKVYRSPQKSLTDLSLSDSSLSDKDGQVSTYKESTKEVSKQERVSFNSFKENEDTTTNEAVEELNITLSQIESLFKDLKLSSNAKDFYYYYDSREWKFPNGNQISNNSLNSLANSWERREQQFKTKGIINGLGSSKTVPKKKQPEWLDEYIEEIKGMEG